MSNSKKDGWAEPGRRWDAADARAARKAHAESGLTAEAFARRHGFSAQRLRAWGSKLEAWSAEVPRSELLPVVVVSRGADAAGLSAHAGAAVVVRVGAAVMEIRDTSQIGPAWLADVLTRAGARP